MASLKVLSIGQCLCISFGINTFISKVYHLFMSDGTSSAPNDAVKFCYPTQASQVAVPTEEFYWGRNRPSCQGNNTSRLWNRNRTYPSLSDKSALVAQLQTTQRVLTNFHYSNWREILRNVTNKGQEGT